METEEERRARLENDGVTKWLRLAMRRTKKKITTGEDGSYRMAQVGHGDRRRKKSKTGENGSYLTAQVGLGDRQRWNKEELDRNICQITQYIYIPNNLYHTLIVAF